MASIKFDNISFAYGEKQILKNFSQIINITSDMKKINKYVNKSIIENAFVNYEGYVGILNCLPT